MSRRRVLFVSPLSGLGGGETSLLYLMNALRQGTEYDPLLWSFTDGPLVEKTRLGGIPIHVQFVSNRSKIGNLPIPPLGKIIEIVTFIRNNRIDLIHINGIEGIWVFGIAAMLSGIPLIWTCHGPWFTFRLLQRWLLNRLVCKIVPISVKTMVSLQRQGVAKEAEVIPLGIPLEVIEGALNKNLKGELGLPNNCILVGVIGRFQYVKGQDIFIRAAEIISEKISNVGFVLVGGTPFNSKSDEKFRDMVHQMAQGVKGPVFFLGERYDVASILKGIDLLVVPSRTESFGMVVVEAMAARCPVIATRCGGPEEVFSRGYSGPLIPTEDHVGMAGAIISLVLDEPFLDRLKGEGTSLVSKHFSVHEQARRHALLYTRALGRSLLE